MTAISFLLAMVPPDTTQVQLPCRSQCNTTRSCWKNAPARSTRRSPRSNLLAPNTPAARCASPRGKKTRYFSDPMRWANPKASNRHSLDPKQNNGSQLFTTSGQALGDRFQSCPWRSPPEAMHIRVVRRPSSSWRPLTCRLASGSCLEWSVSGVEVISCKGYQIVYEDEGGVRNPSWFCKTLNSHKFSNSHQPT